MSDPPHLETQIEREEGLVCIRLSGVIDEQFSSGSILRELQPVTILEVSGVRRITSFGVRQWSEAMKALPAAVKQLYLVRCPPVFVDQLNMVLNFGGRAQVISAYAAFFCEACQLESTVLLDIYGDRSQIGSGQLPDAICPKCQKPMQPADDPQLYARLVNEFGAKALVPSAAALLERTQLHQLKKVGKPPEATKLVHDHVTMFRLSGTLDARFRQRRLASGVEGDVVFDLAEIEGLDSAGAERWRELFTSLTNTTSVTIADVPEVLLPAIADGSFVVAGAGLYSYQATFRCADCGNTQTRALGGNEPIEGCTRPCGRCGRKSAPAVDAKLIARVLERVKPAAITPALEEVIRTRHELLARARAESGNLSSASQGDSLARYRVIKPLTEGGMAEIFLAVHQGIAGFEKLVVLKKILRRMLERRQVAVTLFLNEAKIAANLNHPNIVQTFEVGEHGGDLFIAMEYIHGIDVRQLLRQSLLKNQLVPVELLLYIAERVAAGLHHAHTAKDLSGRDLNVVHRDVSPSNIILGFDGQVKLLDFGVASASVGESVEGLIGKFSYMSPEQLKREPLDGRSDVFALGVVLHEMLSRKPLFRRETDQQTVHAVLRAEIPHLVDQGLPAAVDEVVQKALSRDREQRYPDARAFQVALEQCIRKLGATPGSEQLQQTLSQLFPDQSAAPSVDPALYRSSSEQSPSASRSSSAPTPGADEQTSHGNREDDRTIVNDTNPSQLKTPKPRQPAAPVAPFAPTPSAVKQRHPAVEDVVKTVHVPPEVVMEKVQTFEKKSRTPSIDGMRELQPMSIPPAPAAPIMPLSVGPSTPLPAALADMNLKSRATRSAADYWLIAAAIIAFVVGFLLVVF